MAQTEAKLFVGNLPPDIKVEELNYVFGQYGAVSKAHVMDASRSKSGQACAFVSYTTPEAAAVAIQTLNNVYKIRVDAKEAISVSVAKSGGNMSEGSSRAAALVAAAATGSVAATPDLAASLSAFAPAFGATALGAPAFGAPALGHPLLNFGQPLDAATVAAQQLAAAQVAAAQLPLAGLPAAAPAGQPCKLFVGDLPADIAREAIQHVFQTYGTVTDVHLMTGKSRSGAACALVEYSNASEAQIAINTLHQKYEIKPGSGMITVRMFEGKGKGKGGAAAAPAAPAAPAAAPVPSFAAIPPVNFDPLGLAATLNLGLHAGTMPAVSAPDPAGLRFTPY